MQERFSLGLAAAITFAALLAGCSNNLDKPYFRTAGVAAPDNYCPVDPRSFGKADPVPDLTEPSGCGLRQAFRVYSINGVNLSEPAIVRCALADTLNDWLLTSVQAHAKAIFNENVVSIKVAASYSCRPRNNVRGAKLSEHGMGNAIDIAAFTLASGREVNVLNDWYSGPAENRAFLRAIRAEACGPFHTVLGPGSDAEHHDHIHLDLQKERSGGPYCH